MKKLLNSIKAVGTSVVMVFMVALCIWGAVYWISKPTEPVAVVEAPKQIYRKDEYYVRMAAIYEGNVDWRFYVTTKMLESMAPQFIGKPLLLAHDWSDPNMCVGRVIDAAVKKDQYGSYVEIVAVVTDLDAVERIASGGYLACSIGFEALKAICMIDNKDPLECEHMPGRRYKIRGEPPTPTYVVARHILQEVRIHELSFVNVPASPHARVLGLASHRLSCRDK